MRTAFAFDGQGSQAPGMGKSLYDSYETFREAFDEMDPTGRYRELCFEGSEEELALTQNTQPCMVCVEIATAELLHSRGVEPAVAFGLSLGEYSALAVAGALSSREAVELVAFRGQAMAKAAEGIDCGMAAVMGLGADGVEGACAEAVSEGAGYVAATNYNCPGQIVISGEKAAVDAACEKAMGLGAKRCIPLAVSGPFHTRLMESAACALRDRLSGFPFGKLRVPVLFNVTAAPLADGASIADMMVEQVKSPVRFEGCVREMLSMGISTMVEIGPSSSLGKFAKKVDRGIDVICVGDAEGFEKAVAALKEADEDA